MRRVLFGCLERKQIAVRFEARPSRSDGGSIVLRACGGASGLTDASADSRGPCQPGKITPTFRDLLRQRVFGLAFGFSACKDAARLKGDRMPKLLKGRTSRNAMGPT